ncbi:hypothetical protein [Salimicrobium halophilum]|uniref:Uncharacterized protein n=1 Tax=Salimicrobium halophilum TaxID=86666 RepID=A0A1G8TLF9_9BACI|nr:hypothetical protein [Salimicrobium halophilum]SDJ42389.1 hypothetical protein SAMN04490247_1852 [Salimicrobium halophilum]
MRRESIVIEGEVNGMRFEKYINVYVEGWEDVEHAILRFYGSSADSFSKLMMEQGWRNGVWTYAMEERISVVQ